MNSKDHLTTTTLNCYVFQLNKNGNMHNIYCKDLMQ